MVRALFVAVLFVLVVTIAVIAIFPGDDLTVACVLMAARFGALVTDRPMASSRGVMCRPAPTSISAGTLVSMPIAVQSCLPA